MPFRPGASTKTAIWGLSPNCSLGVLSAVAVEVDEAARLDNLALFGRHVRDEQLDRGGGAVLDHVRGDTAQVAFEGSADMRDEDPVVDVERIEAALVLGTMPQLMQLLR